VLVVLLSWLKESMTVRKLTGILLGFFGVLIVSFEGLNGYVSLAGILLALISALGWTFGTVYVKKNNENVHWLWLVAMQIFGGLVLIFASIYLINSKKHRNKNE
jgi:drug/metabolite transporter (DMT)-like permease